MSWGTGTEAGRESRLASWTERHTAGEILEGSIGLGPAEDLADLPGEGRSFERGFLPDPLPDLVDLLVFEVPARIALHEGSRIVGRDRRARRSEEIVQGSQGDGSEGWSRTGHTPRDNRGGGVLRQRSPLSQCRGPPARNPFLATLGSRMPRNWDQRSSGSLFRLLDVEDFFESTDLGLESFVSLSGLLEKLPVVPGLALPVGGVLLRGHRQIPRICHVEACPAGFRKKGSVVLMIEGGRDDPSGRSLWKRIVSLGCPRIRKARHFPGGNIRQ